jgi:hypothetical protein
MKLLFSFALIFLSLVVSAQADSTHRQPDPLKRIDTVEVSCGQCNFKLKTQKGCDLAVRINGKSYFVDGTKIDDHGDAHASDGFCSAIRKARVQGEVVDGRFKACYFVLLPIEKTKSHSD